MTVLHPPAPQTNRPESLLQTPEGSPRREKLRDASRGLKLGIRSHSSFFVHFFFAMLVLATGLALHCSAVEWCLLGGCFAMVFITELCSSAVETIHGAMDAAARARARGALQIMAGAVLVARLAGAMAGTLVLLARLWNFLP